MEIRCCCAPENLMGHISEEDGANAALRQRELTDGSFAFASEDRDDLDSIPGFVRDNRKGGKKTWRKK